MSPRAIKALALTWFYRGFSLSGIGFHGENYRVREHAGVRGLLRAEFNRIYEQDADEDYES
jgi:hypothetical protein